MKKPTEYYSPDDWEYDTLLAHLESMYEYHKRSEKDAHKKWLMPSMTSEKLKEYHRQKKEHYEQYLDSIKLRRKSNGLNS
jgi:hypothetical protein